MQSFIRLLYATILVAVVSSCAANKTVDTNSSNDSAPVVRKTSAPEVKPVEDASPTVDALRRKVTEATSRAVKAESNNAALLEQANDAQAAAEKAFQNGLLAGSAEAASHRDQVALLRKTAELASKNAEELSALLSHALEDAATASSRVTALEANNRILHSANEALKGELVETREVVGKIQSQLAAAKDDTIKAQANAEHLKAVADRWRRIAVSLGVAAAIFVTLFIAKIVR